MTSSGCGTWWRTDWLGASDRSRSGFLLFQETSVLARCQAKRNMTKLSPPPKMHLFLRNQSASVQWTRCVEVIWHYKFRFCRPRAPLMCQPLNGFITPQMQIFFGLTWCAKCNTPRSVLLMWVSNQTKDYMKKCLFKTPCDWICVILSRTPEKRSDTNWFPQTQSSKARMARTKSKPKLWSQFIIDKLQQKQAVLFFQNIANVNTLINGMCSEAFCKSIVSWT